MRTREELLRTAGRKILRSEHEHFREAGIDDARHIPRISRIAAAIADVAREAGTPVEEAVALEEELVAHGRELWLGLCMSHIDDDEDPAAFREESAEIFEQIRTADDPWSVYR